jgi:hypothetical protein
MGMSKDATKSPQEITSSAQQLKESSGVAGGEQNDMTRMEHYEVAE